MKKYLLILCIVPLTILGQQTFTTKGKFGFKENESIIIPASYDYATDFINGFACVKKEEKWGYINAKNEWLSKKYDKIQPFSNGYAAFLLNGKIGLIDSTFNEVVKPLYSDIKKEEHYFEIKIDSLVGMQTQSIQIPCKYKWVGKQSTGFAYGYRYDRQYDVYDENGLVLENQPSNFSKWDINNDKNVIARKNGKYGLFNTASKKWSLRPKFEWIEEIKCDNYKVGNKETSDVVYAVFKKHDDTSYENPKHDIFLIQTHSLKTIIKKVIRFDNEYYYRSTYDCSITIKGKNETIMLNELLKDLIIKTEEIDEYYND